MAQIGHFDATQVAPTESRSPLPAGKYLAIITESTIKPTKNGLGEYIELVLEIQEGEHKGRKLWDRLNIKNPNAQAVEIAQRQLSALCHAAGVLQLQDTEQLHYKPVLVRVSVRHDAEREPSNEVKGYEAVASNAGQQPAYVPPGRTAAPAAHAPAGRPAAPWAKAS